MEQKTKLLANLQKLCYFGSGHNMPVAMDKVKRLLTFLLADINECSSNPCQNNGSCNEKVNSFSCGCVQGYTGSRCETG